MSTEYDSRVDAFIADLPDWQQELCCRLRELIHEAEPDIQESIKRTIRPYFLLDGNVCALQSTRDHINVFIYDPVAADPLGLINQGKNNTTARSIQLYQGQKLDPKAFKQLISAVAANNRAGGWRRLSATSK